MSYVAQRLCVVTPKKGVETKGVIVIVPSLASYVMFNKEVYLREVIIRRLRNHPAFGSIRYV